MELESVINDSRIYKTCCDKFSSYQNKSVDIISGVIAIFICNLFNSVVSN
jgi:hypothetical protein